jgi:hypothetical protein
MIQMLHYHFACLLRSINTIYNLRCPETRLYYTDSESDTTTRRRPIIVSETLGVLPTKYGSISNGHYPFSIHRITIRQLAHIIVILNRAFWLQDESDPDYTLDMILVRYIDFQYLDTGCMEGQRFRKEDWLLRLWGKLTSKRSGCHVGAHRLRMLPLSAPGLSRELTTTDYPLYAHTSESSDR